MKKILYSILIVFTLCLLGVININTEAYAATTSSKTKNHTHRYTMLIETLLSQRVKNKVKEI